MKPLGRKFFGKKWDQHPRVRGKRVRNWWEVVCTPNKRLEQRRAEEQIQEEEDMIQLSEWTMEGHASFRYILGTDPAKIANRVAFIEKTPRVRVGEFTEEDDWKNWEQGPKGSGEEYGMHKPSRRWCDARLFEMRYSI